MKMERVLSFRLGNCQFCVAIFQLGREGKSAITFVEKVCYTIGCQNWRCNTGFQYTIARATFKD
jgi:hypothetical protein